MNTQTQSSNNLHFKPISSRIFSKINHTHALLQNKASENNWKRRLIRVLSKVMTVTGYIGTMPVALIETLAIGIIGGLGTLLNAATKTRSNFLRKHSAKSLAYALNSLTTFILEFLALTAFKNKKISSFVYPKHRTLASLTDQISHLGTAAFIQSLFTTWFDKDPKNNTRVINTLREGIPDAIIDIGNSLILDFAPAEYRHINVRHFFNRLTSEQQNRLRNLDIRQLRNQNYQQQFVPIIRQFMQQAHIANTNPNVEAEQNEIVLNPYLNSEKAYQTHLKECVKTAIKTMNEKE